MITVIKRDGSTESFDPQKIENVTIAAGISQSHAEQVATAVERWLEQSNIPQVASLQIRDKVVEEMQKHNETAANAYRWYESTKDSQ